MPKRPLLSPSPVRKPIVNRATECSTHTQEYCVEGTPKRPLPKACLLRTNVKLPLSNSCQNNPSHERAPLYSTGEGPY